MTWNVAFDIAFEVSNCPNENGTNVNPQDIRDAIKTRLNSLSDDELQEAIGFIDSIEEWTTTKENDHDRTNI